VLLLLTLLLIKMPSHGPIGVATCHRLLSAGSGINGVRVSKEAAEEAQKAVRLMLERAGREASGLLRLKKTKTVNMEVLSLCFRNNQCLGVGEKDLTSAPRKGKGQRGVPVAGAATIFRSKLSQGDRLGDDGDVGKALVGAAEAYLKALGKNAGLMASAGRRTTIKGADLVAATQLRA
jgi:histone H3/H4